MPMLQNIDSEFLRLPKLADILEDLHNIDLGDISNSIFKIYRKKEKSSSSSSRVSSTTRPSSSTISTSTHSKKKKKKTDRSTSSEATTESLTNLKRTTVVTLGL